MPVAWLDAVDGPGTGHLPSVVRRIPLLRRAWIKRRVGHVEAEGPQLALVVGTQRTGTNVLREVLCSNPKIGILGEVFSSADEGGQYRKYLSDHHENRPYNFREAERQFRGYLRHLHDDARRYEQKIYGFDVKYSQLRAIVPEIEPLCSTPFLAQMIRRLSARVIHVVRDNVLQSTLSELIAGARGIWHHRSEAPIDGAVTIDCRHLLQTMREKQTDRNIFASLMAGYDRLITIHYERLARGLTMVDDEGVLVGPDNPFFAVADFLGVPRDFRNPGSLHKIVQRPYAEIIANYSEVRQIVRRTEFAKYLKTI